LRIQIPHEWQPRPYQRPLWDYLERGGREAVAVWHRRAGKDEVGLHRACVAAHERPANYWHMLPEATQARKAIWAAVNPKTGKRRIDEAFPQELRKTTRDHEMAIEFKSGASWQVVGSDNFNSLVGASPAGIVYSEWALANPSARAYLRPIIAENKGWELFLYTPRGRNHGLRTLQAAQSNPDAFAQVLRASDTKQISQEVLDKELAAYIKEYGKDEGEAFFLQEFDCDFNAPLLGAILGRYVTRAERAGRINNEVEIDPDGSPIHISSDIGFRDTASWWFWQPKVGGFSLVDYDHDTGLEAKDWITRLRDKNYTIGKIYLPHDAKAKTFAAKHSAFEQFADSFGWGNVELVPLTSKTDRINAARSVIDHCEFHATRCSDGMDGLREWSYEYDDELKTFSKEPKHDWASHPGDGFSYGAQMMREYVKPKPQDLGPKFPLDRTINQLIESQRRKRLQMEE
jgi:phage terminase large subunit